MTRRKSNNVVRHNGGIGSGVGSAPFAAATSQAETESGEDIDRPDIPMRDERENSHEDQKVDATTAFRLHLEEKDTNPEANLVMDLSSREELDEHQQQSDPRDRIDSASHGHSNNVIAPPPANEGPAMDDDMDDAGIYGDMAEGDMVAAMLEEAQIPRSQFLGLNAEEKQKLLEARRTCKFCGKVCIKRSDLQRHLLVHTGERPWLCKVSF